MAARKRLNVESRCLPDDLVESIVALLPPKKIANLSIMSKRFRNTWTLCRNLSFDRNFAKKYTMDEYTNIVSQFFHFRVNTNIDSFKLFFDPTNVQDLVCSWIEKCTDLGIKELELDFSPSTGTYVLGSNLLEVETLKVLRLMNVELDMSKLPLGFASNLTELRLQCSKAQSSTVEAIFLNCLQLKTFEIVNCNSINLLNISAQNHKGLEKLVVKHCNNIRSIRINAPTICMLHYHGKICEFFFNSIFPRLENVILGITPSRGFQMFPHREDLVGALKNVRTLMVTSPFLEMLSIRFENNQYMDLEFYLMNLKEYHLVVQPESYINPFDIAVFLRRCPQIERVFIDLGRNSCGNSMYWDLHGRATLSQCSVTFPFIKIVKIKGFTVKEPHVTMARFFLKFAQNLERLILVKARNCNFPEIFTPQCMRQEIESHAHIQLFEHRGDRSAIFPEHFRKS